MAADAGLEALLASGAGPERLVPSDTGGLVAIADTLRAHAALLDEGGWSLSRVEVTSWRGAASDGFGAAIEVEPARWRSAAEAFLAGAIAVEGFVAAVGTARDAAASAAQAYREYERAAAVAIATAGIGAVAAPPSLAVGARVESLQRAQAGGAAGAVGDAEGLRRQAIALLASARSAVDAAGDLAAHALGRAAETAPAARRFWEPTIRPADLVGAGHTTLDWAGMLPGVGAAPDAVNAGWYAVEGDWGQAGWSAVAMAPVVGDWLAATRRAVRAGEALDSAIRVPPRGPASGPGWLATHEVDGSHTLERHVGATRLYLVSRLYGTKPIDVASSFASQSDAERLISRALEDNANRIERFLANPNRLRTSFKADMAQVAGYGISSSGKSIVTLYGLEVFLIKDSSSSDGYRIWTAYPAKVG